MSKFIDAEKLRSVLQNTINSMKEKDVKGERYDAFLNGKLSICEELLGCITSLQQEQPSLPSNIDEAAEEYSENILANNEDLQDAIEDAFKEGAKWMARQGVTLNLSIDELSCGAYNSCVEQGLTSEDDVIIQIRKKQ